MSDDAMYRTEFLRRSQNLKHTGGSFSGQPIQAVNPLCGDEQEIDIEITDGIVTKMIYQPKGCLVSKVATDLVIDAVLDKPVDAALTLTLEDIEKTMGIKLTPSRRKCAELGLSHIQDYLKSAN